MGCKFCSTGAMGWARDLTTEEIIWQIYAARVLLGRRIDNIVFMGMGEPLDNLENVTQALRVAADQRGLDIAHRHITLSTAGHAEGIEKLADLGFSGLRLAVSLNAVDDAVRSELMPINRNYPLARLKKALHRIPYGKKGVVFVEYVLLAGLNDGFNDAKNLAAYLAGLPARVNLIAYNAGGSAPYAAPEPAHAHRFCRWLRANGLFAHLRQSRGERVLAACGQLGASLSKVHALAAQRSSESERRRKHG